MKPLMNLLLGLDSDFKRIFFKNESIALAGYRGQTIIALLIILFFTFLALGFAVGSLGNLKQKMDNPFTNWVDLPITESQIAENVPDIQKRYNETIGQELHIKNVTSFSRFFQEFYQNPEEVLQQEETNTLGLWGRTIESESSLLGSILNSASKNLIWSAAPPSSNAPMVLEDGEIIVTLHMLELLGYKNPLSTPYIMLTDEEVFTGIKRPVFLKVKAIVKELPSFCRFAVTPKIYNILKGKTVARKKGDSFIKRNRLGDNNFLFLTQNEENIQQLRELTSDFFKAAKPSLRKSKEEYQIGTTSLTGVLLSFFPTEIPPMETIEAFSQKARTQNIPLKSFSVIEHDAPGLRTINPEDIHYLAFNFNPLNLVRQFREDMYQEFDIEIDMTQIEAKENFALVSQLTFAISLILLGFGILSIVLFVNNLLRTHLFEVRSNLGTFQAFGLNDKFLIYSYLKIIFSFIMGAVFIAFTLAAGIDQLEYSLMREESRFDIFSYWVLYAVLGLLSISLIWSMRTINKILINTPGDLIYKR